MKQVVVNDEKKDVDISSQNDKKNEKWHKQKIVSGLGEMLKQLKGECEECEEDLESESTAVIETDLAVVKEDVKENELLREPVGCDEIIETDLGERFPDLDL